MTRSAGRVSVPVSVLLAPVLPGILLLLLPSRTGLLLPVLTGLLLLLLLPIWPEGDWHLGIRVDPRDATQVSHRWQGSHVNVGVLGGLADREMSFCVDRFEFQPFYLFEPEDNLPKFCSKPFVILAEGSFVCRQMILQGSGTLPELGRGEPSSGVTNDSPNEIPQV